MARFIKTADTVSVIHDSKLTIDEKLAPHSYTVYIDEESKQYKLRIDSDPETLPKLYGKLDDLTEMISSAYRAKNTSMGVILMGEKGSGKSLLSLNVSEKFRKEGMPTVNIHDCFYGDKFNAFMALLLETPCVIVFNEFDKYYKRTEYQEALLTLFDGTVRTNNLFLLLCNNKDLLTEFYKGRPSRFYYAIPFKGVDKETFTQYCKEHLNNKDHIEDIVATLNYYKNFNFDMMKALVAESNLRNVHPFTAIKYLNFVTGTGRNQYELRYEIIAMTKNGVATDLKKGRKETVFYNGSNGFETYYYTPEVEEYKSERVYITPKDVINIDYSQKIFEFKNSDGFYVKIKLLDEHEEELDLFKLVKGMKNE